MGEDSVGDVWFGMGGDSQTISPSPWPCFVAGLSTNLPDTGQIHEGKSTPCVHCVCAKTDPTKWHAHFGLFICL